MVNSQGLDSFATPTRDEAVLLPCPFCGGKNIDPEGWASIDRKGPACDDCSGCADTVELWNSRPLASAPANIDARKIAPADVVMWAVDRWNEQVKNRPLVNIHRRSLDDAWRRVMRDFGGDPDGLVGPPHDELHDACIPSPKGDEHIDAPAPASGVDAVAPYPVRVAAACAVLFDGDPTDVAERRDRFAEEALEVVQAFGMSRDDMHALVDYTFGRPVGEPPKEIGAAMTTLASLANEAGYGLMECAEADLASLMRPETIERIRAKRATRHGRGPLPGLSTAATETGGDIERLRRKLEEAASYFTGKGLFGSAENMRLASEALASLSPAATPVSEAGGDDWMEQKAAREKREAEIMQEYRWGNLTPLGVANHLKRAGFNIDYAVKVSNALAKPASSPAGGDVVETLVPLKWRHVDVEQFEAHSIIGTYEVCGQHWSFVPTLKKAGAEMGSLDEARKAAQSHRDMYGPQPRRAALSQSTSAGRVGE